MKWRPGPRLPRCRTTTRTAARKTTVIDLNKPICAWLTANGIPPNDVPIGAIPQLTNGQIRITTVVRNANGGLVIRPNGDLAQTTLTVPLKVDPPAELAAWLRGEVPYR